MTDSSPKAQARLKAAIADNIAAREAFSFAPPEPDAALTFWPDRACRSGTRETVRYTPFRARILSSTAPTKDALPSFSGGIFGKKRSAAGSLRHRENHLECTAIIGDHDAGTMTPEAAAERMRAAGLHGLIYTTPSYRPDKPRWRVVTFLARPCGAAGYKRHAQRLNAILGGALAPESTNAVGFWYFGQIEDQPKPKVTIVSEGVAIDDADVPANEPEANGDFGDLSSTRTSRLGQEAPSEIVASALAAIPNDERDWEEWNRRGMQAYAATRGREEGLAAWIEWSAKHPAHDEAACLERWQHYRRSPPSEIGAGSLFHDAVKQGWHDPRKDAPPDTGGDLSNARVLAHSLRDLFLFDRNTKRWLRFDGVRWLPDAGEVMQEAKAVADARVRDAARALTENATDEAKRRFGQAQKVHQSAQRIEAMVRLAQSEPGLSADADDFDRDPFLLGVPNGVVDLRTGTLRAASARDMLTKAVGVPFDPDARCPRWETFLREVFGADAEVTSFIQRAIGYSLTGDVREEVLFFAHGSGRNGKSVFAKILTSVLGDYAVTVGSEIIARQRHDNEAARGRLRLRGARLALANEVGVADTWDDHAVKTLVSREAIAARALYGEAFDFEPTHHLWIRGNHQPAALDADDGFWRRVVLIPFTKTFPPGGPEDLEHRIFNAEGPGILAWAVRGCLEWQRGGLRVPDALRVATQAYRNDTDILDQWFRAEMMDDPHNVRGEPVRSAYDSLRRFCVDAGTAAPSRPAFVRRAKRLGMNARRSNNEDRFPGFTLRTGFDAEGV